MKAVVLNKFGGPAVLTVADLPEPVPGPGEIAIRTHGASVNPADALIRGGHFRLDQLPLPWVLGMELAGTVAAIGPDTLTELRVGDPVFAIVLPLRPGGGAYAEVVVVPESWASPAPDGMDLHSAATLPMNGLTALLALDLFDLQPGDLVGLTGPTGSFGHHFIQLASDAGLQVVTAASPQDEAAVRAWGARHVLPRAGDTAAAFRQIAPTGVPALADAALLGPDILPALADGGAYASLRRIGEEGTRPLPAPPLRGITYLEFRVNDYVGRPDKLRQLREAAERGTLTPYVADVVPPEQAGVAHTALSSGGVRGRLVLDFS